MKSVRHSKNLLVSLYIRLKFCFFLPVDEVSYVYLSSGEMLTMLQASQNFRYYVLDNNILLGIFEDVSRNGGYEQQAKVAIILRGMSSRQNNIRFEFSRLY